MDLSSLTAFFRRNFSAVLIVIGVVLLAYVGVEYADMYTEQRQLEREWQTQQVRLNESGPRPAEIVERGLTRISIPKIDLTAMVVKGTGRKALKLGPGLLEGSPEPGTPGNVVITAHRDTFFRNIGDLKMGDQIMLQRDGKAFTYEVTGRKIVAPNDVSVIQPTNDNRLTLITCYPVYYIGPAPERLIVTSRLVGEPERNGSAGVAGTRAATTLPEDSSKSAR
ncbi:MAG TPA: class D sortase [Clostridia bacterium]|nr:class D sortase [Clostridia bacterium]